MSTVSGHVLRACQMHILRAEVSSLRGQLFAVDLSKKYSILEQIGECSLTQLHLNETNNFCVCHLANGLPIFAKRLWVALALSEVVVRCRLRVPRCETIMVMGHLISPVVPKTRMASLGV